MPPKGTTKQGRGPGAKPGRIGKPSNARSRRAAASTTPPLPGVDPNHPRSIHLGDTLQIERRYVVDGILTCVTDKGRYSGVQQIGNSEHLILEDPDGAVRMIPLPTISEIHLLEAAKRAEEKARVEHDPSFA